MKIQKYKQLSTLVTLLLTIITTPCIAQDKVPTGQICKFLTGTVPEAFGTGECSGNNLRAYDLSSVYPGMVVYYNSMAPEHNVINLGKKVTFSDVSFVDLNTSNPYFWTGDGTLVDLEYRTVGSFANSYLAKDRNQISDYFKKISNTQVTQYAMDGTEYYYTLVTGTRYKLSSIKNRIGIISEIGLGLNTPQQVLKYGADQVQVSNSGVSTTFRNTSDTAKWAKLTSDSSSRLVSIEYYDGTKYLLGYQGSTSLLTSESLVTSSGSEVTKFAYDTAGRLSQIYHPNNTSTKYTRDIAKKVLNEIYPNGEVRKTKFDQYGHVQFIYTYPIDSPKTPTDEMAYKFNPDGKFLSMEYPRGDVKVKYVNLYYPQDKRMPIGYEKYENGVLVEVLRQTRGLYTWESVMDTYEDGKGKILSQVQYGYAPTMPYLLTRMEIKEGPNKGYKEEYAYEGAKFTQTIYNEKGTKVAANIYNSDLPFQKIDYLAPAPLQTTEYGYDAKKNINSLKVNGKEIAKYAYDANGRETYYKDELGEEHFSYYDSKGYVTKEEHKLPGGLVTINYQREFHSQSAEGDKIKSLTITRVYPKETETKVEKTEYDVDGKVVGIWVNGVLVG